ncbi:hypothetical protein ACFWM7_33440 [Streptomyces sp. NPDC058375]|uniref:hypothetical protein n=1 Tax=Streptomyces sp. NPDC058375 TaxID=3346467 RepID=UPI00365EFB88
MPVRSGRSARGTAPAPSASGSPNSRTGGVAPVAGRWITLGKDGRLTAYARHQDGLLRWTQSRPGGAAWTGPELIEIPGQTHLAVAQGRDGFVHVMARRSVTRGDGPTRVDFAHAIQYQTGRPLGPWSSLGNPHKERDLAVEVGSPVVAVSPSGAVYVFVRSITGSVMLRRESKGGVWEGWKDLKGGQSQDAPAVSVPASGGMELFAPGDGQALRWVQAAEDGAFGPVTRIPVQIAPGGVAVLETAPGRHTYYWTDPAGNGIVAHRPGTWVIPLGGAPAEGPATVLRAVLDGYDCTVIAHRELDGQVMLAACGTENEGSGVWWSPTGERTPAAPALALDAHGRVVLGMIGSDGALYIAQQNDEPGLAMAPAVRVG